MIPNLTWGVAGNWDTYTAPEDQWDLATLAGADSLTVVVMPAGEGTALLSVADTVAAQLAVDRVLLRAISATDALTLSLADSSAGLLARSELVDGVSSGVTDAVADLYSRLSVFDTTTLAVGAEFCLLSRSELLDSLGVSLEDSAHLAAAFASVDDLTTALTSVIGGPEQTLWLSTSDTAALRTSDACRTLLKTVWIEQDPVVPVTGVWTSIPPLEEEILVDWS